MSRMHACPGGRDSWSRAGNERSSIVRRFADLPIGRSFVTSCCRRLTLNLAHVLQTPIHNVPQILRCKSKRLPVDAEAIHAHLYVLVSPPYNGGSWSRLLMACLGLRNISYLSER